MIQERGVIGVISKSGWEELEGKGLSQEGRRPGQTGDRKGSLRSRRPESGPTAGVRRVSKESSDCFYFFHETGSGAFS